MNTKIIVTGCVFLLSLSIMISQSIFEILPAILFSISISSMMYMTWDALRV